MATVSAPASRQAYFTCGTMAVVLAVAPFVVYPVFVMKALCLALFACAFNLLLGYVGLLSFGHAMFFGASAYGAAYAAKEWGASPGLAILSGTLLGGLGRVWGPVVGAIVLVTLENYLGPLGGWFTVIQGILFIVCVLVFRQGIVGEIALLAKRSRRHRGSPARG